jgi:MutS domain V
VNTDPTHPARPGKLTRAGAGLGRLWRKLQDALGTAATPPRYEWFTPHEIASLHRAVRSPGTAAVDDATWHDLQLDAYMRQQAAELSVFGRQMLWHRLRCGDDVRQHPNGPALLQALMASGAHSALVQEASVLLQRLRHVEADVAGAIDDSSALALPGWTRWAPWIPLVAVAALVLASLGLRIAALALFGVYVGVALYAVISFSPILNRWRGVRRGLVSMLRVGLDLVALAQRQRSDLLPDLVAEQSALQTQWQRYRFTAIERVPGLLEYANLLLLYDFHRSRRQIAAFVRDGPALLRLLSVVADVDLRCCLVRQLDDDPAVCWPQRPADGQLRLAGMVNPLLRHALPLDLQCGPHGISLSGQNGVGKSTLLRAVGLNVLVCKAFGFCHAQAAAVPTLAVCSSMHHVDSIQRDESLYMAELRRAHELLEKARSGGATLLIFDEIFKGTNHTEAIAAAVAVLRELVRAGAVVLVSTHTLVVAQLMRQHLAPWRLLGNPRAEGGGAGQLTLEPGLVLDTNGIALMRSHDFPPTAFETAAAVSTLLADYELDPANFRAID